MWWQNKIKADLVEAWYFQMISPLKIVRLKFLCKSHLSHACYMTLIRLILLYPNLMSTSFFVFQHFYFLLVNEVFIYKNILKTRSDRNGFINPSIFISADVYA
jgi:hypothetical protein